LLKPDSKLLDYLIGPLAGRASIDNMCTLAAQAEISFPFFYFFLIGPNLNSQQLNIEHQIDLDLNLTTV